MITANVQLDLSPADKVQKGIKTIIRKSVNRNTNMIVNAVKAEIKSHKRTGNLYKSLTKKVKSYSGAVVSIVGPKSDVVINLGTISRGKRKGQPKLYRPSKIAHIVLGGGNKHWKGTNALKTAQASTQAPFADAVAQDIRQGIEEIAP